MAVVVTHNDTILKKAFWLFTTGLAVGIGYWRLTRCRNVSSVCLMGGLKLLTTVAKVVHVYLIIIGAWLPSSNSHNQSTTWRYCLYQPFIKAADCVSRWPRLVAQLAIGVYNLAENDLGCRVVQRKIDQQKEVVDLTRRPSVQRTWYELERLGTRFFLQKMKNISGRMVGVAGQKRVFVVTWSFGFASDYLIKSSGFLQFGAVQDLALREVRTAAYGDSQPFFEA
ncbi:hypothetical protein T4B_10597 [Trichinella pseudospiralis]|uniref:Uncharacterized protein n=1 Tax=Trichinella pseudospiralis TaxID=6337 RepID=A0A0V1JB13_TRIPS|nr:hypothetical protein T4B_10597 [Trichinella pseudospiralis]